MNDTLRTSVPLRLTGEDYKAVAALASKVGLPVSEILRRSVRMAVPKFLDGTADLMDYAALPTVRGSQQESSMS